MKKSYILFFFIIPFFSFSQNAEYYFNKALEAEKSNNLDLSIKYYTKSIELSENVVTYFNRAQMYSKQGKYFLAIQDYTRVTTLDSNDAGAYLGLGMAYYFLNQFDLSLKNMNKAIDVDPNFGLAWNNRGVIKSAMGLPYCQDYRKACRLGYQQGCENIQESPVCN